MLSSEILHRAAVARARRASATHTPNPDSACVCHKCETARQDRAMISRHTYCDWTNVAAGIYCDTHADWVIYREWEV